MQYRIIDNGTEYLTPCFLTAALSYKHKLKGCRLLWEQKRIPYDILLLKDKRTIKREKTE